jgi:hypothetical protein
MALELLSGPHELIDLATGDTFNGEPAYPLSSEDIQWVDPWGFMIVGPDGYRYVVQMDGSTCRYGQGGGLGVRWLGLSIIGADPDSPSAGERWCSEYYGGVEYAVTHITKIRDDANIISSDVAFLARAHVHDRFLRLSSNHIQYMTGSAGSWVTETNVTGFSGTYETFSWAREGNEIWCGSGGSGQIFRYNFETKMVTSPVYTIGMPCRCLSYSAKHDVFVSLHNTYAPHQTRVWARTPSPASVSAPTASPAVKAGLVSTLRCRVLGDAGEPCADEVVAWSVTGDGVLSAAATATDEDGYAEVQLAVPLAATADAQVDVELAY